MRNLSTLWTASTALPPSHSAHVIAAPALDVDEDALYILSELVCGADVELAIWRTDEHNELHAVASTTCPAIATGARQLVLAAIFPETRDLCLITLAGDITLFALPPADPGPPSILGTVSPGIGAASLSPDASLVAVVSAGPTPLLILMHAPALTIITEVPLHTSSPGAAQPVTAGWGSKATQFHGSLGKHAAHAPAPPRSTFSPDDDGAPRIAWRGDAQFFAVSAREETSMRRIVRVYDRSGALQSTAEDVPGLEHALAWCPGGALIAGTQRFGSVPGVEDGGGGWGLGQGREGRHDVVFFERNGLRHGEFTLREAAGTDLRTCGADSTRRWGYRVRELAWNSDSSVLAVWIEREANDVVQLWTTGNYHWYLKLALPSAGHFTSLTWHPEDAARLILSTPHGVSDIRLTRYTATSALPPPHDTGLVAVIDGGELLLTSFRTQNVPPPMAGHRLPLASAPPTHIAFSHDVAPGDDLSDTMALVFGDGAAAVWEVATRPRAAPRKVWHGEVDPGHTARQVGVRGRSGGRCVVAALCAAEDGGVDVVRGVELEDGAERGRWEAVMPGGRGQLVDVYAAGAPEAWTWQGCDGRLWEFSRDTPPQSVSSFPEFCTPATRVAPALFVGLAGTTLLAAAPSAPGPPLSTACSSYSPATPFLIYTTTAPAHAAVFFPLSALSPPPSPVTPEQRRIERGARIVVAIPSTTTVVLQMPRGNLESITPRPLVLARLRDDILRGEYGVAFRTARKHRVDLNLLVETDPAQFARSIGHVVTQLNDIDYLNLFLENLGCSTQPAETIAHLCDAIRVELEARDVRRYLHAILTAHVVKKPPDYEAALRLLLRLREEGDAPLIDDAVRYVIFLADADCLFDTALGMYDFGLVLLVAQYSQKDPREYLPFLRKLRALAGPYQRFAIDDHLGRRGKALHSLREACTEDSGNAKDVDADGAEEGKFEEAKRYVVQWRLYEDAVRLWEGAGEQYEAMLELYGDYLFERREFGQAAFAFVHAKRTRKAMVAYEKALEWQTLFDLMLRDGIEDDEVVTTARRVADDLGSKSRHGEAARVLLDYMDDVQEAVAMLVRGGKWSEARRIATLRKRGDLFRSLIAPGIVDARFSLAEEISEIDDLRMKQVARLDELAAKKIEEPDAFYGMDDIHLENVDVMTDVSNPGTTFTRYTVAPPASSRSKRTSRSKRKLDRKAGRKGTVEEEEYLLQSLVKLMGRVDAVLLEGRALLPHLLAIPREHAVEGRALQSEIETLESALRRDVERIWDERATLPQGQSGESPVALAERVPRPVVSDIQWRIRWISSDTETGT